MFDGLRKLAPSLLLHNGRLIGIKYCKRSFAGSYASLSQGLACIKYRGVISATWLSE
jgi:hypothetical protein